MRISAKSKKIFREYLKWVWVRALWATGLLAFAKYWIQRHGAVVLSFHRILTETGMAQTFSQDGIIVRQTTFDSLLGHLKSHYVIIDLAGGRLPRQSRRLQVAITFDDGWEDNASVAFPIAARHGVPFTIFICSGKTDRWLPFWPDRIVALIRSAASREGGVDSLCEALDQSGQTSQAAIVQDRNGDCADRLIESIKLLDAEKRDAVLQVLFAFENSTLEPPDTKIDRTMSWAQAEQLCKKGIVFGSHTHHHEILTRICPNRIAEELELSKKEIENRLLEPCLLFSYPNGDASPEARDAVAHHGFSLAFLNSPGVWLRNGDPFLIPRINLCETKLVGKKGEFSPLYFEYSVFWRAFRHRQHKGTRHEIATSRV
jgi:peptidoglycan/xylan/chitin deacetylase (PgdA/CDA1 family)